MLPFLLLTAVGKEPQPLPAIAIHTCVDVDAEEVRRLAALELGSSQVSADVTQLEVTVACAANAQELTVTDRTTGTVTVRSIDLNAELESDRDAAARELALAIAELVRRTELERAPAPTPTPREPATASQPAQRPRPTPPEHDVPTLEPRPWRAELGVTGVVARWSGGEVLMGVDATGRLRFGDRWISDLRLGGRKTRPIALESGGMDGSGISASAGVSFDVVPYVTFVGVSVGVRFGADWLRYATVDGEGSAYGAADVRAFSTSGTATAFIELVRPLSVTADAGVGTALHSIRIRDNGRSISGMRGVLLSGALGLSARF